jgi:NAD-dependent DNA ligase
MSDIVLSPRQLRSLGEITAKHVKRFFKNPENEKRFEDWFQKTYGISYAEHLERRKHG